MVKLYRRMKILILLAFLFPAMVWAAKDRGGLLYFTKGAELAAKKKYHEAVEQLAIAIKKRPNYLPAYVESARALVLLKKRRSALQQLNQAMQFAKKTGDIRMLQTELELLSEIFYTNRTFQLYQNGQNYLRLDRAGAALSFFEKALLVEPDNVAVLTAYASALFEEKNLDASKRSLDLALELNPQKKMAKLLLAELMLKQRPDRTVSLLQDVVLDSDASEHTMILYAQASIELKKYKEATELLRNKLEGKTDWVQSSYWLGKLYEKMQDGLWNARKYYMVFLKRVEHVEAKDMEAEYSQLREDAESSLKRIDESLQISSK